MNPDKTFLVSDLHMCHENILRFDDNRSHFKNIEAHDEFIIESWNRTVKNETDTVIVAGDLFYRAKAEQMEDILIRLNGKIRLVRGNHDKKHMNILEKYCSIERDIWEIPTNKIWNGIPSIVISHYPLASWNKKFHGSISAYGHVHHPNFSMNNKSWNIAIHLNDFKILTLNEVKEKIESRDINETNNL